MSGDATWAADQLLTAGVPLRRVWAWLIDVVLIAMICAALWGVLFVFGVLTLGLGFPLLALVPAVPFAYHLLFLAGPTSATPGQALLGLTVRRNDDFGRPSVAQALVSTIGFYATLALGVIWLGIALLTARRRTLHDIVSGLVVVRRRALTPRFGAWNMAGGSYYT
jgi:uncharacterized RDD family membrane protein YckC